MSTSAPIPRVTSTPGSCRRSLPISKLLTPLLPLAVEFAERWIAQQRDRFRERGEPLDATQWELLDGYFEQSTLESVRIVRIPLKNPAFYTSFFRGQGSNTKLLDLTKVGGITYGDTIVINETTCPGVTPIGLLFHELVHVVQYKVLGIRGFADHYVRGWAANGFNYHKIPMEVEARALQREFEGATAPTRTVEEHVGSSYRGATSREYRPAFQDSGL